MSFLQGMSQAQKAEESLSEFLQPLRELVKNSKLKVVTGEQYRKEIIWDLFMNGLCSANIQQSLLENKELTLDRAFDLAFFLDCAPEQSTVLQLAEEVNTETATNTAARETASKKCFFCGRKVDTHLQCIARIAVS